MSIVVNKTRLPVTLWQTESGSVVSISDARKRYAKSLSVALEPIQDLHGYSYPWAGGAGKNLYDGNAVTDGYAINAQGEIEVSDFSCYSGLIPVTEGETYTYSGICNMDDGTYNNKRIHGYVDGVWSLQITVQTISDNQPFAITFTVPAGVNGIRISASKTDENRQVEKGSSASSYSPYENICTISGHSAVNVYDDPKYGGLIEWNQLASLDTSDWDLNRISMSVYGHSVTLIPTSDSTNALKRANLLGLIVGHKYVSMMMVVNGSTRGITWGIYTHVYSNTYTSREIIQKPTSDTFCEHIWDVTTDGSMFALVLATSANTSDQVGLQNIQLFDLTAMFGAGNEPTLEQFRALFPKDYYPYNAGTETLVSAVNGDPYISVTVQLGQTVYGGTVDLVSGLLTADMVSENITTCVNGPANYVRYVIGNIGYIDPSVSYCNMLAKHSGNASSLTQGKYMVLNSSGYNASQANFCFAGCRGSSQSTTRNLNQEKLTELNNAGTPLQIVYKLATPLTIQLSTNQIEMLMRNNTVWSDDGIVTVNYARIRQ